MKTECPHCGQHYDVDEEYIGQVVECVTCGKEFTVKTGSDVATIQAQRPGGKMKALVCEMCGSTDLIKQNGLFVCQSCGIKYSLEEARKMMIEGTVDVSGSVVRVDNSASIDNFFKMAKSAYESSNQKEAESYCNKIIEIEPENYKAWLLKGKAAGWQSTLANLRIEEAVNCFTKAVDNAPEDDVKRIKKEAADEIGRLSTALMKLCCDSFVRYPSDDSANSILQNLKLVQLYTLILFSKCGVKPDGFKENIATMINNAIVTAWQDHVLKDYTEDSHPSKFIWEQFKDRCFACIAIEQAAIDLSEDDDQADIQRYKNMIDITEELVKSKSWTYSEGGYVPEYSLTMEAKNANIDNMMKWHEKIHEIDPNYSVPPRPAAPSTGGCFIATAVYGSYDCPEVWTLRRFRDYSLGKNWYGRLFVEMYYAVSPKLVKHFGHTRMFQLFWRKNLDKLVKKLNRQGISSTPYVDRNW
jgi:predicted Zn finger-like uncharacterized protein